MPNLCLQGTPGSDGRPLSWAHGAANNETFFGGGALSEYHQRFMASGYDVGQSLDLV